MSAIQCVKITGTTWGTLSLLTPSGQHVTLQSTAQHRSGDAFVCGPDYERWAWKKGGFLVNTSTKKPLAHSPGLTPEAVKHAVARLL